MPKEWKSLGAGNEFKDTWLSPDSFATTLIVVFLDHFGTEGLSWDPNTVQMEVEQEFGVELPAWSFDRLMTAISLVTTDAFYTSCPDFVRACVVFSGHTPAPGQLILPDCGDLAWGMTEGMLVDPPEGDSPFHPEIVGYIGHALDEEGIITPPDVLRIGTRSRDLAEHVRYNFADDPGMFAAIQGEEASKTKAVNDLVRARLRELLGQLRALPLNTGSTQKLADKLLAALPGDEDLPLPDYTIE